MRRWHRLALVALVASAGCGELQTPDLAHGAIEGQVVGASVDGYAYPFGAPGLVARVGADGRFRISGVPAGSVKLLVYDDTRLDGTRRAELVDLVVPGAGVARLVRNGEGAPVAPASKMAPAGMVVASLTLAGGGLPLSPRFAVPGTELAGSPPPGRATLGLGQLPVATGFFHLATSQEGYLSGERPIDVASATNAFDVSLEIDHGGGVAPGCGAIGGGCVNGLVCDTSSGSCVQCLGDADCAAGVCDLVGHFCAVPAGGVDLGRVCATCTADSQCLGGATTPAHCELGPGASSGFCTWAPATVSECPSGFELLTSGAGLARCLPAVSCSEYFSTWGQSCFTDDACRHDGAIPNGVCHGADPSSEVAGYCTAPCQVLGATAPVDTCIMEGFTCDSAAGLCLRP